MTKKTTNQSNSRIGLPGYLEKGYLLDERVEQPENGDRNLR